jgi:hypothetical protein
VIACLPVTRLRELWPALHETVAGNADGTPKPRLSQTLNDMLMVMLLTAQRRGEVCTSVGRTWICSRAGG